METEQQIKSYLGVGQDEQLFFVRSDTSLALHSDIATGRILALAEVLEYFGSRKRLLEAVEQIRDSDTDIIVDCTSSTIATTLKEQRLRIGISVLELAQETGLLEDKILRAEDCSVSSRFCDIEVIAQKLSIDERLLGSAAGHAVLDEKLAIRLKSIKGEFGVPTIFKLLNAAWTINRQSILSQKVTGVNGYYRRTAAGFSHENIKNERYPCSVRKGKELAGITRRLLGLDMNSQILMGDLVENELLIPLVCGTLPLPINCAVINNGGHRGLVLSSVSLKDQTNSIQITLNQRLDLAYGLYYLLWASDDEIDNVKLCSNSDIHTPAHADTMPSRSMDENSVARCFALELLAPSDAVNYVWHATQDFEVLRNYFGLGCSNSSISYLDNCIDTASSVVYYPSDYGADQFSDCLAWILADKSVFETAPKDGLFRHLVKEAARKQVISADSAESFINASS